MILSPDIFQQKYLLRELIQSLSDSVYFNQGTILLLKT